ncbi:hypothetical protein DB032_15720 [Chromobacterium sp. Panama]|nr:hypothetical protein DB032_15720 [Chromobacterium sp. Panama]
MTSPSTLAKPPPAPSQEQQRLLSQTLDACAMAFNCFALLRSTLTALQSQTPPASHQYLLADLSIQVLDDYAARFQHLYAEVQQAPLEAVSETVTTEIPGA